MHTFVHRLRKHGTLAVGFVLVVCAVLTSPVLAAPSQQDKQRVDKQVEQAEAALESATSRAQEAGKSFVEANQLLPGA